MNRSVTAALRDEVLHANQAIPRMGLATLTWGNVSGIDRDAGVYVIKPSGVSYDDLTAEQLVVVDLEDGRVVDGYLRPSVDSETHRRLYLAFGDVGGITHTHSPTAVAFAQAKRDIPVLGTTHATLTWGNVSGIDRDAGVYVIKPSGVSYDDLTAEQLVVVDLEDGRVVDGYLRPSVDSETHRRLYLAFGDVGGITHTHSPTAVAFAQAKRDIPVLGTTHADTFNGPIRCTRDLTEAECATDYEYNTGQVIVDLFDSVPDEPAEVPGALVANHGPFVWGEDAGASVKNAIICEAVAQMAIQTLALNPHADAPPYLLERHYRRKHGPDAYYGNPQAGQGAQR